MMMIIIIDCPGDTGKLRTLISVINVENAHWINLATPWTNEYPMDKMEILYEAKLLNETLCL